MKTLYKKVRENLIPLSFILSVPIISIFYKVLNTSERGVYSVLTQVDRYIPFVPEFILAYVSWYPYLALALVYFCLKDRKTYYNVLLSYNIGAVICYLIYFFFQTTMPRPMLVGDDIFTSMVSWMYSIDAPFNCFPSMHVMVSWLMMSGMTRSKARNARNLLVINGIGTLIILSTMFIKQHSFMDAVAGIILAEAVLRIVEKIRMKRFVYVSGNIQSSEAELSK